MANPQIENGFTKIANELYDAIVRWHFSSYEYRVLIFLIRKTYGWGKKEDWISLSQFVAGTNIRENHICRTIKLLVDQKIIVKAGSRSKPLYGVQKDFDLWVKLPKGVRSHHAKLPKGGVQKGVIQDVKGGNSRCKRGEIQKKLITKETFTKENGASAVEKKERILSPSEQIMDIFYQTVNPGLNWGNKTNRSAAEWIIKKFPNDALRMAEAACSIQGKPYAPTVTTPYQLKEKLGELKIYFEREKNKLNQFKGKNYDE